MRREARRAGILRWIRSEPACGRIAVLQDRARQDSIPEFICREEGGHTAEVHKILRLQE